MQLYEVTLDTETALAAPGKQAPPLTCVSVTHDGGDALLHQTDAKPFFEEVLRDPGYTLIGHNIAYDFGVVAAEWPEFLPDIFAAYRENRVRDTMLRWQLLDIGLGCYRGYHRELSPPEQAKERERATEARRQGKKYERKRGKWVHIRYDLSTSYHRFTGQHLEKDEWRLKYGPLRNVPLEEWPEGARHYPLQDSRATHLVYNEQKRVRTVVGKWVKKVAPDIKDPDPLGDECNQARYAWWIHLMRCTGIRTNAEKVAKLEAQTQEAYSQLKLFLQTQAICAECGRLWVQKSSKDLIGCPEHGRRKPSCTLVRHTGKRNTAAAKIRMMHVMGGQENCRLTDTGQISLDEEACKGSNDMLLEDYAALSSLQTVLSKDISALLGGTLYPVHSYFTALLATGRTSSSGPNIQNIRRLPGIRECFVPRKGKVFLNADYDGLELRTLAQVCIKLFKRSKLAEVLNAGEDPHLHVAAALLKISYLEAVHRYKMDDPEVGKARQFGKIANFGFAGGLGYEALILFAKRSNNILLTIEEAQRLKDTWLATYPELGLYFDYINTKTQQASYDGENLATIEQLFTKRIRGRIRYTVACNTYFQGLGSDATKHAGWLITEACFLDKKSPLYGCRIVNYIHDEFILECDEDKAHEACLELARIMEKGASVYLPDVPPKVSKPLIARCWSKDAKQVWEDGKIVPWEEAA